jgi:hypothetical protein
MAVNVETSSQIRLNELELVSLKLLSLVVVRFCFEAVYINQDLKKKQTK